MIKIEFSEETRQILFHNFIYANHSKTRQKNFILYLKSMDFNHQDILKIGRISEPTLVSCLKEYITKGIEGFKELKWSGAKNELEKFKDLIDKHFEASPPKTINEAKKEIEELTGIRRSPTQIRVFLKTLGYKYLKTGSVPSNGKTDDIEKERDEFKKKNLNRGWRKQNQI